MKEFSFMKNKRLLKLAGSICLMLVLVALTFVTACATKEETPPPPAGEEEEEAPPIEEEPIVLTYASGMPDTHFFGQADLATLEKIEEETNGRVSFETYFGGTLVTTAESVEKLEAGVVDLAYIDPTYDPKYVIVNALRSFWYGCPSEYLLPLYEQLRTEYPEIESELAGVKILGLCPFVPYSVITADKPIHTLADFSGLRFKAVVPMAEALQALGAEVVPLPAPDMYISLQKKIIDGVIICNDVFAGFNLYEVTKYTTRLDYVLGAYPIKAMNLDTWNSLPPEIQDVFEDNFSFWGEEAERLWLEAVQAGNDIAMQEGVEFIELEPGELDKFNDLLEATALEQAANLDAIGFPGTEIFEEVRRLIDGVTQ
jgi:TRAP-type C4-dicarboxylate transport system substrate-binding protein